MVPHLSQLKMSPFTRRISSPSVTASGKSLNEPLRNRSNGQKRSKNTPPRPSNEWNIFTCSLRRRGTIPKGFVPPVANGVRQHLIHLPPHARLNLPNLMKTNDLSVR